MTELTPPPLTHHTSLVMYMFLKYQCTCLKCYVSVFLYETHKADCINNYSINK